METPDNKHSLKQSLCIHVYGDWQAVSPSRARTSVRVEIGSKYCLSIVSFEISLIYSVSTLISWIWLNWLLRTEHFFSDLHLPNRGMNGYRLVGSHFDWSSLSWIVIKIGIKLIDGMILFANLFFVIIVKNWILYPWDSQWRRSRRKVCKRQAKQAHQNLV